MWNRDWQANIRLLQRREEKAREVLGISSVVDQKEIKRAWRQKSLEHHPDHNNGNAESHKQFVLINCAYKLLTEGVGGEKLDEEKKNHIFADEKYQLDNPWGYLAWWREKYF